MVSIDVCYDSSITGHRIQRVLGGTVVSDSGAKQASNEEPPDRRRAAAILVCDELQEVLSEGLAVGGEFRTHTLDIGLRKAVNALRDTYPHPAPQLPEVGLRLWRRIEAMIDAALEDEPRVGWVEFTEAVDSMLGWVVDYYALRHSGDCTDPDEWNRRVQFDEPTGVITLDGTRHTMPTPAHFFLVRRLVVAAKSGNPWVKQSVLAKAARSAGSNAKAVDRLIAHKKFPEVFRQMIQSTPGRGSWIRLPPHA